MNDFILSSLDKLKNKKIPNPEIDLRILLNHSKKTKHEIILSNFNLDFIDIKMVDEDRYKKPIGIYWSQSITNFILGDPPYDKIWIYRLPSFFGIFLCFIFIFFSLKRFETPATSFLTIFFICSVNLILYNKFFVEQHNMTYGGMETSPYIKKPDHMIDLPLSIRVS